MKLHANKDTENTFENMPEVTAAVCARNFGTRHAHRSIFMSQNATYTRRLVTVNANICNVPGIASKNAGHPQPLSNFVSLVKSGVSHPAHA
jgi:hypothetical protein